MTDRCPSCGTWHLIFDSRARGARCTNPDCDFQETLSYADYLRCYADRSRMVVLPKELGGGLNPEWRGSVRGTRQ
ncbi:MAG: hypothetical protein Q7R91_02325 [bacterium]|nr:hypothetical protein [bacterium]